MSAAAIAEEITPALAPVTITAVTKRFRAAVTAVIHGADDVPVVIAARAVVTAAVRVPVVAPVAVAAVAKAISVVVIEVFHTGVGVAKVGK